MKSQDKAAYAAALLRARNPLLWVVTREEARAESYLFEAAANAGYLAQFWDVAAGFTDISGKPLKPFDNAEGDPDAALGVIKNATGQRTVWILRDFPAWITGPTGPIVLRRLRNLARPDGLPSKPSDDAQAIIMVSPTSDVPPELSDVATVIEWPLPDREEIADILDATIESLPEEIQAGAVNGSRDAVIDAAIGLSGEEAQASFAHSLVDTKTVDPAMVAAEKERSIRGSGLEWMKPLKGGMKAVGGLNIWKTYAVSRAIARTPAARAYGLQAPKGVVLLGVPGCGKTLSASALASEWNVPLIKADLNAMKGKFVGQSEASIRNALSKIDAIGPCVLLIDEIEKALAGATGDAGDGGVSADALGTLLSWMNDRDSEAYVIATANNIDKLPPELLRKGRFDDVWWIGLPNEEERAGVITAALRSHGRDADTIGIDVAAIAAATENFSGAEIAALVPEAMFTAFAENAREITTSDILAAAKTVKPKGTDKKRPDFAREATSTIAATPVRKGKGRVLDMN